MEMKWKRVGVLMGGMSNEREVSLMSGHAVAEGLRKQGYDVVELDATHKLDVALRDSKVEAVFIALHGPYGEDGTVQGMLELMAIPYTGSSVTASAVAMDKILTRVILTSSGLPVADGFSLNHPNQIALPQGWTPPVVVKPACSGSSVGISIVQNSADFESAVKEAFKHSKRVLVEQLISGIEVTVAVLDGKVLGALEVEPHRDFYDYGAKYEEGGATNHIPPRIPVEQLDLCLELGLKAYNALDCRGAARVDFVVPNSGTPVILELNTSPGMTNLSLLPDIAAANGLPFNVLVAKIMERAELHLKSNRGR
jgi:D-alanine-D-alanine ligase